MAESHNVGNVKPDYEALAQECVDEAYSGSYGALNTGTLLLRAAAALREAGAEIAEVATVPAGYSLLSTEILEGLQKDAERYRWYREHIVDEFYPVPSPEQFDEMNDMDMAAARQQT